VSEGGIRSQLDRRLEALRRTGLVELFRREPGRFEAMHARGAGLLLDYSRNLLDSDTLALLVRLAEDAGLRTRIRALFAGENVNASEDRPALHTALRDFSGHAPYHGEVAAVMAQMQGLTEQIHSGEWQGSTGRPVTDVVNIGIGGSHLGPMMAAAALSPFDAGKVRCHFVSNLDGADLRSALAGLSPETTLFIVASKSFTTLETLANAKAARDWLAVIAREEAALARHFLAVTARPERAAAFGIAEPNILPMWDWVGGRFSLWSGIGLPVALSAGMEVFNRLRRGAAAMDEHFRHTSFDRNLPVLLALLDIWYLNFWNTGSRAVLPYLHHLRYFPEFLQQLEMESNGKSVRQDGRPVEHRTAGVVWGNVETNGQHSFHQLLHQGTQFVPAEFIVALQAWPKNDPQHPYLFANCLAQASVLMTGRSPAEIKYDLAGAGITEQEAESLAAHQQMPGNRPSSLIVMDRLTPETLGALIALYEHKVYAQSVIWDINAFDQYGVEWGKVIGTRIANRLTGETETGENLPPEERFDPATEALIALYKNR